MPQLAPPAAAPRPAAARPAAAPQTAKGEEVHPGWEDWPASPGTWQYAPRETGGDARFGLPDAAPLFALRCDRTQRHIVLERSLAHGAAAARMLVRASGAERSLPTSVMADGSGLMALLSAQDPLLDAMAFSRGKFIIGVAGVPDLVLPSWAEVGRVIEDCRAP